MRVVALGLCCLLLLAACQAADENKAADAADQGAQKGGQDQKKPLTRKERDELLKKKLQLVIAAVKQNRTDTSKVEVESDVVEEAPEAKLWAGYGDLAVAGACEDEIARLCGKVEPGEGRLEDCLTHQLEEEEEGDAKGPSVSEGCRQELAAFKADRASNVNKDLALAKACRDDIKKYCKKVGPGGDPLELLDCLRRSKKKLSDKCEARVFEEQEEEAKDWRVDARLQAACKADAEKLCDDVDEDEEGATTECLLTKVPQLSALCRDQLKRAMVERADDIRLERPLLHACSRDMRRFCKDVEMGEGRMEACLQDHREQDGFSERCRQALEARMERQAADYQLNYGLREYCAEDIDELCKEQREAIAMAEGFGADAQVITCLETQRDKIRNRRCRKEVKRQMRHEAEDIRFDHALATACHKDVKERCHGVAPGSARVIACLQEQREQLSPQCASRLFQHEVRLAEDIDFKYPLRQACVVEIELLCRDVPHGHARVVRCLQDNIESEEMSDECRAEVKKDELKAGTDFRLNVRLTKACTADVQRLCKDAAKACEGRVCGGVVLECLQDKLDQVQAEDCRTEVLRQVKAQATDYRASPTGRGACAADVQRFCKDVEPGGGRTHACLREHMEELSERCRKTELRLMVLQARDIRLRPQLWAACSEEVAVFCKGVEPGKGRVYKCLAENMSKPGFGEECRQAVSERIAATQTDYRLDYGVGTSCQADAEKHCAKEMGIGKGQVLRCLVAHYKQLGGGCQDELSRGVRRALWAFKLGAPLTQVCDTDVMAVCPGSGQQGSMFKMGSVGTCLSKAVAGGTQLTEGCRALVLVAAPRDARSIVADSTSSVEAVALRVAEIVKKAGLSSALVNQQKSGLGAITITGWVAFASLASLVLLVLALAAFGAWHFMRGGRQQHRYSRVREMKQGDV
ncbi:hypothetical protein COHA_001355 [Chlorella ohadii]|uniref:Golgi apparatus protein 1 n=1 Tax=Chlorella ohadii TaxID=2649997 RepID=A0AAD5DZ52_9CHLO|nr:hypothetical protein COHA_001355 [Chlorella ohadii]